MQTEPAQLELHEKIYAWYAEDPRRLKATIGISLAVVAIGLAIGVYIWHENNRQTEASDALTQTLVQATIHGTEPAPDALVQVAADHPSTAAASHALLLAAGRL